MNNSAGQVLMYIILLLFGLGASYWFYNNFTWVNEEKEVGFQGIAKTNKLLASEFFLRKMGVKVQQVNGLIAFRDLPSEQHTLLIATQRDTINNELSQKLLSWVRSGGHLIVEARYLSDDSLDAIKNGKKNNSDIKQLIDDDLLKEFIIFSNYTDSCECKVDGDDLEIKNIERVDKADEVMMGEADSEHDDEEIPINVAIGEIEIEVNFPYDISLQKMSSTPQLSWLVKDDISKYLMQLPLEKGLLTVLTSTDIFNNSQILQFDHARFLYYLVQQQGHDAGVWLIRVDDMPPLWQLLWKNAWYVMFSLSLLFFFWLWRAPLRFGPKMNDTPMARRSLLEHIQASGYYRWHDNQSGYLLSKVQNTLWDKIRTTHPAIRREIPAQAYMKLAEITAIKEPLIKEALMVVDKISEQDFVKRVQMLGVICKRL